MVAKRKNKSAQTWSALQPGDLIDVIAPGSRCSDDELRKGLEFLKLAGYRTRVSQNIFGQDVLCANTDDERWLQLKSALLASDSKAVWCVRGGYGAIRLSARLAKLKAPKKVKLLIGYSDISTLHQFVNQFWKWPSLHGPLLDRLGAGKASIDEIDQLKALLRGEQTQVEFNNLEPINAAARKIKTIRAPVFGGNLVVVNSLLGTPLQKHPTGILFFEERAERGYRVDRLLIQMELSGMFKNAKAIVLGQFIGGLEPDGKDMVTPVIERFAQSMKIPVLRGLPAGHGDEQRPVFFNTSAELKTGSKASLVIASGAVR